MSIFIIGIVIFLGFVAFIVYSFSWKLDKELTTFGIMFSAILTTMTMFFVNAIIYNAGTPVLKERPIYSLERSNSTHGSFFLGTGSVNSNPVYYFYMGVGKDEYVLNSADAKSVVLAMSDTVNPHIEYYNKSCIGGWVCSAPHKTSVTKITVPTNTIKKKYNVN